jgi:outer membrane protein TolC
MTLPECLQIGLQQNFDIRLSRNAEQIAKNNATLANAGFLPSLDASASYTGANATTETTVRENGSVTTGGGAWNQTLNAGIDLTWTLFDGFRIVATYDRLKELRQQGETNTRIAIEDLIANLTAEYYNYIQQQIRLNNLRYAVTLSRERLRIVEARYNIGNFSRLDLQQARVDFNADSSSYMKQQELLSTSRINLNELMANTQVDASLAIADTVIDINTELKLGDMMEGMLMTNSSLIRAQQNKTLAELDMKSVLSRNYPYLRLNSGYDYGLTKYGTGTNSKYSTRGFTAGVTIGVNLFDGNRARERRNARIAIDNAALQRQQLELSLKAEVANLWQAYQNNLEVWKLEQDNLVAAKENYDIAMERYMIGDLSGFEMREAQKSLLDAEERILTAAYDTKLCEISLLQISGQITDYLQK